MATPRLAPLPKPPKISHEIHHLSKKPLPESALTDLKVEIMNLMKEDKRYRYLLGQKLDILQKERARGRTGTFMRDLKEMHIGYHKANRLINFFRRAHSFIVARPAKLDARWGGIENVNDFERALESKEADKRLAALNVLADAERDKVKQAQAKSKGKPQLMRVGIALSDPQKAKFKKAWSKLTEKQRATIVYKAVLDAAQ